MTSRPARKAPRAANSGMVLVAALMVLALLSILSIASLATSTLEVKISAHDRDAKQAFYLCEAGIDKFRYEIVKGWGEGTGAGSTSPYSFSFTAASMPASVKSGGVVDWGAANKWANFTLVDGNGVKFRIQANDAAYNLTQVIGSVQPATGRATLIYDDDAVAFQGIGTAVGTQLQTGEAWGDHIWDGFALRDSAGNYLRITQNLGGNLDLNGTPAAGLGTYTILRGVGGANAFTLCEDTLDTAARPGGPNALWRSSNLSFGNGLWFLRDRSGAVFAITGTAYQSSPNQMVLTVAGTPADGAFQIVTIPWLAGNASVTYDNSAGSFPAPSGTTYGSVTVTATPPTVIPSPPPPQQGTFTLRAVSSSGASEDSQEIRLTARVDQDGLIRVTDWRQGP